jgi:hypothetical protein
MAGDNRVVNKDSSPVQLSRATARLTGIMILARNKVVFIPARTAVRIVDSILVGRVCVSSISAALLSAGAPVVKYGSSLYQELALLLHRMEHGGRLSRKSFQDIPDRQLDGPWYSC